MSRRTKEVSMHVVVRVPNDCTAAQARREVRTLLNEKCMHTLDEEQIRAVRVTPQKPLQAMIDHWIEAKGKKS